MNQGTKQHNDQPALFIGIDWANDKHDCYVIDRDGKGFHQELTHSAESIDAWVADMLKIADGKTHRHHAGAITRSARICSDVSKERAALPGQSQAIGPLPRKLSWRWQGRSHRREILGKNAVRTNHNPDRLAT